MDEDREIELLRAEVERLRELAHIDELTGLYNRHGFKYGADRFISELFSSRSSGEERKSVYIRNFSLIIFDIDDFKNINDTHGHQVGDDVLKFLAAVIKENVRDIDPVARWGGEEIVLGLVGASEEDAFRIAERIREQIMSSEIDIGGQAIRFTISGGVASIDDAGDFDEMLSRSDKALYKAKRDGKNKVIRHSDLGE